MIPSVEIARPAGTAPPGEATGPPMSSGASTIWKMLFEMPEGEKHGANGQGRCAGCDTQIPGTGRDLPAFCVFCRAWGQWRREGDELWAHVIRDQDDDRSPPSAYSRRTSLAAGV